MSALGKLCAVIGTVEFSMMYILEHLHLSTFWENSLDTMVMMASSLLAGRYFLLKPAVDYLQSESESIFTNIADGLVIQDQDSKIVFHNRSALRILNLTSDQLLGKTSMNPTWQTVDRNGQPLSAEQHPVPMTLKSGQAISNFVMGVKISETELRWIRVNSVPRFSEESPDQVESVICTFSDFTEERRARLEAEAAITRFTDAASAVGFGVWDWNLKTGTLIWDPIMYKIFGIDQKDFVGDYDAFEKTLLKEDAEQLQHELNKAFGNQAKEFKSKFRIHAGDGSIRHIAAAASCFYDSDGKIEKIVGFNWDITAELELKEQVEHQQVLMSSQLKMASLGEMAGGIAHEINNPLTTIQGRAAQLIRALEEDKLEKEKALKYLEIIFNTSDRIARIVSGLRSFSRDADKDPMVSASLKQIIENTLSLCQERYRSNGVQMHIADFEDVELNCRPTQISQVLLNLLNNAFDAAVDTKEKWVRLEIRFAPGPLEKSAAKPIETRVDQSASHDHDSHIEIAVIDSGKGISMEIRNKIMNPFFTTKDVGQGTGLGLSISQSIAADHGGKLEYDPSHPNTRFKFRLPHDKKTQDQ